jgi:spore maturation protein CgeB
MRILYISHSFGSWGTTDDIWDRNLKETLIEMGHQVILPSYDQNKIHKECSEDRSGLARLRNSEAFVDEVKHIMDNQGVDIVFTYFDNRHVLKDAIYEVRKMGAVTINFFCNAAHEFYKVSEVAPAFEYCMVPERDAIKKYIAVGAHPIHVQMAANPKYYHPVPVPEEFDAVFVGNKYLNREEYLANLRRSKVDVRVYGPNWLPPMVGHLDWQHKPRKWARSLKRVLNEYRGRLLPLECCNSTISDDEMVELYSRARITIGLSDVLTPDGNIIRHIRLRDFEAPMCGSCYITGFQEELAEYYEIGREIVCYYSKEDLKDKVKYYLRNSTERDLIRSRGRKRALTEHTWQNRFEKLFKEIGLIDKRN